MQRKYWSARKMMIPFSIRRWNSKIVRKRLPIPSTHSKAGTTCQEWKSKRRNSRRIGRVSTGRTCRWPWSSVRFLVDSRWLRLSSVILSHEYNSMCRKKNISLFHWKTLMLPGLLILIWTSCKKRRLTITGMSIHASICQTPGENLRCSLYWKRNLQKDTCGPCGRLTQIQTTTRPHYVWPEVWTKIGKAAQNREKAGMGERETEAWQCSRAERDVLHRPRWQRVFRNYQKRTEKTGKTYGSSHALHETNSHSSIVKTNVEQKNGHEKEFKTMCGCMVESHESTRQRAESLQSKAHEDRIAVKGFICMAHYNLVHKFIPMPQAMKIPDAIAAVDEEWKKLETIPAWDLEKVKSKKGGYSGNTRRQKEKSTLLYWRTSVTSRLRSWSYNYRSTKAESCVVTL